MTPLIPSGRHWITTEDQPFTLTDGTVIVVPKGFKTDGHSLGPVLSGFLNAYSYDMYAALLHDFLYRYNIGSRKDADLEYLRHMKMFGASVLRRYTFYTVVRLVSWLFWYSWYNVCMKYLKSRRVYALAAMFLIGGIEAISEVIPDMIETPLLGFLGLAVAYFSFNPSQDY